MLAHCISARVPLARLQDYGLMPSCEGWNAVAYGWQDQYLDMVKRDLVSAGLWDSFELCSVVRACVDVVCSQGSLGSPCTVLVAAMRRLTLCCILHASA